MDFFGPADRVAGAADRFAGVADRGAGAARLAGAGGFTTEPGTRMWQ